MDTESTNVRVTRDAAAWRTRVEGGALDRLRGYAGIAASTPGPERRFVIFWLCSAMLALSLAVGVRSTGPRSSPPEPWYDRVAAPAVNFTPTTVPARILQTGSGAPPQAAAPPTVAQAAEAGSASAEPPWQVLAVKPGDTLAALFSHAGLAEGEWAHVMALAGPTRSLRKLYPGEKIRLRAGKDGALTALRYPIDDLNVLEVTRGATGLVAHVNHLTPSRSTIVVSGTVDATLSQALRKAGLDAQQTAQVATIFHPRVDFRREVRAGTRFAVVYDQRQVGERRIPRGPVRAAELVLHDRTIRAFRFTTRDNETAYYDRHGESLRPTLVRTPLHYTRVSSPFSSSRLDPVLHVWRPHKGVDLAAPIGTPVQAAGDGRIAFRDRDAGYGNLIIIDHFGPYSTRYAHLRGFAPGLHVGSHVREGQVIGYVGQSGEATGPHLHFEIRVNGTARNPLTVELPPGQPLTPPERARFLAAVQPLLALVDKEAGSERQLSQAWLSTPRPWQ
jgi:murein DD-endopeptidase MepM/ murein hydrolase activator NlpD